MDQTQGGVRVRTLWLGKATLLFDGTSDATGFAGMVWDTCFLLEPAAHWNGRNIVRKCRAGSWLGKSEQAQQRSLGDHRTWTNPQ
jgi:hypothetical protein